jgi:hypothetical protein
MTYQEKTLILRILEYLIAKYHDQEAKTIMEDLYGRIKLYVQKIASIFQEEGAVVPLGHTEIDVNTNAAALYDNAMDIHWLRGFRNQSIL